MNTMIAATLLLLAGPKVELTVGAGVDSNPFELPEDQAAAGADQRPMPGAFVPLGLGASWKTPPSQLFRAGAEADFDGVFYGYVGHDSAAPDETSASDGNQWTAQFAVPLTVDPKQEGRDVWHADVTFEPFFGMHRETYTSHLHGTHYMMDADPAPGVQQLTDLARRYDTNEFGGRLEGDIAAGRLVDVLLGARYTSVDYVEDYEGAGAAIESWDYGETRGDVDVYFRPEGFLFAAGYSVRIRDYDERFPRDADGEKVMKDDAGYEPQVFTYHDVSLKGGIQRDRGRAIVRFRNSRRIDEFDGYLTYSENAVSGDFRLELGADTELSFDLGYSTRKYDDLHVAYDPQEPITDRRRVTIDTGFEWPALTKWTRLYVAGGLVSQSSSNPLYSYVDFHATTGVRVNWTPKVRKTDADEKLP